MRLQTSLIERAQTGEDGNCFMCSFYDALYYIVETLKLNRGLACFIYSVASQNFDKMRRVKISSFHSQAHQ